jgi:hypothetical protein
MTEYTIYNIASERIVRWGDHPDLDFLETRLEEGHALLRDKALDDRFWIVVNGVEQSVSEQIDLDVLTTELLLSIDQSAEATRGLFITNTASQPAVYMAKEAEATALMADLEISDDVVPNIAREAQRTGESRFDVAVVILTKAETWRQISAMIEDIRLSAKDGVRAASNAVTKRQAAVIDWSAITALAN